MIENNKMISPPACLDVAVALPVYKTFTYSVPENLSSMVSIGKRVLVPLGRRRVTGYILGYCTTDKKEIKHILDILDEDPLFPAAMLPFFKWIADYYLHPIGEVIKNALPGGLNRQDVVSLAITEKGKQAIADNLINPVENDILNLLTQKAYLRRGLGRILGQEIPFSIIYALERRGLIASQRRLKGGTIKPKTERYVSKGVADLNATKFSGTKKKIIKAVKKEGQISIRRLKEQIPSAPRAVRSLEKDGFVLIFNKRVYRDPFGDPIQPDSAPILTEEQKKVVSKVVGMLGQGFSTCLLTGVTGSGKTEVYLRLSAEAVERGFAVLVLVPEIALISQMERRFRARFGECIAVLHSGLSAGERYDQWMRIARKEAAIAIGARSAVFAPFDKIGLVIVDEEHDTSYKQDSGLRYNARDLAVVRANLENGLAFLGSATPSIQSYYNVTRNKFVEVTLKQRVEKRPLPKISVVDLRENTELGGVRRFISPPLHQAMADTLKKREQVLLFLNRRGFASYPVCATCGAALKCKNCDISLTLHQEVYAYKCHYCGFTRAAASRCPGCNSSNIRHLGLGTEKLETAVKALFPDARIARMDRDTTSRKGSILKLLKGLRNGTIDILVGTQMVAKGHDFPNITLVGIISADLSLSFPDFRACERTFQLLAQVSGRAGRGNAPGRVILQTYNPDHFSILSAKEQDFKKFYNQEICFRKDLSYPPFSRMVQIKISGKDKQKTRHQARVIGNLCRDLKKAAAEHAAVEVLGPIEASLRRIAGFYRWQIILKCPSVKSLHRFLHQVFFENLAVVYTRHVKVVVDVDPYFMM